MSDIPATALPIGLIGGGKIGEALLAGLLRQLGAADVIVCESHPERAAELAQRYGVRTVTASDAARQAPTLLLAVKPQDVEAVLASLTGALTAGSLLVSVVAGVTTARLERALPDGVAVVRAMPNTPALVDQAMTAICAGQHAGPEHMDVAHALLQAVGRVVRVPEAQLDAVTALSGSGPAYVFYLVEAMTDAGILLGLPRALASELITQTLYGAAVMLRESGEHPVQLREAVTSPGGTTISAIRALEDHGVRAAFLAAIEAARDRSQELGRDC